MDISAALCDLIHARVVHKQQQLLHVSATCISEGPSGYVSYAEYMRKEFDLLTGDILIPVERYSSQLYRSVVPPDDSLCMLSFLQASLLAGQTDAALLAIVDENVPFEAIDFEMACYKGSTKVIEAMARIILGRPDGTATLKHTLMSITHGTLGQSALLPLFMEHFASYSTEDAL